MICYSNHIFGALKITFAPLLFSCTGVPVQRNAQARDVRRQFRLGGTSRKKVANYIFLDIKIFAITRGFVVAKFKFGHAF